MPFTFNTEQDVQQMLAAIGAASIEELFAPIPSEHRLDQLLDLPPAMTELELTQHLQKLARRNRHAGSTPCFLGGGAYDHFIPAVVDAIASRGEFYTSYTPYQPEVSQGNLQVMFEYQTLICQLTGMDVSNASLYDGGTAAIEATLLAMTATRRTQKVVVVGSVHPEYLQIMQTYFAPLGTSLTVVPTPKGAVDVDQLMSAVDDQTACVVIQNPNFFGCLEDVQAAADIAHEHSALLVAVVDPISLGLLKRPGDLGADVVVAEGQSLGSPMQYGGPYLGIIACREQFVRRMPGRIAGETVDRRGHRCWVLTLQTREQHIRRAKATSNICTNQGLFALRAAIYLAAMGPQGLRETASLCLQKAAFAAQRIAEKDRFELAFDQPFFKEFVIRDRKGQVRDLLAEGNRSGLLPGLALGNWYPELDDCFMVAVTEKRTREEIEALAACLANATNTAAVTA